MQPLPPGISSNGGPGAPRSSSGPYYLRQFRPVPGRGSAPVEAGLRPSPLLQAPEERGGQPLPAERAGTPGRPLGREREGSWCLRGESQDEEQERKRGAASHYRKLQIPALPAADNYGSQQVPLSGPRGPLGGLQPGFSGRGRGACRGSGENRVKLDAAAQTPLTGRT
ncbi:unnamed protein product [Rangifer tarandus platyrhynchus]|uniref:Uncharacterized protein n=1 Tax=Rangifer tarandus platyrhynchus TaxID=3082113 RepID=A0AC59ZW09_RANTA